MPKSLRTFLEDCQRELPGEVIHITKEVNPANYDVTAIIKHLGAQKKFPIIIFDKPLNLNGRVGPIKLTMNCEISQGKTQIALGMLKTSTRPEIAEKCLEMEEHRIPPTIVDKKNAPEVLTRLASMHVASVPHRVIWLSQNDRPAESASRLRKSR